MTEPNDFTPPKTLAEALALAEARKLIEPEQLKGIAADLDVIARHTQRTLDQLPSAPAELRPYLTDILHHEGRSPMKRWSQVLSGLRRLLRALGLHTGPNRTALPPGSPWIAAMAQLAPKAQRHVLGRFASWCATNQIDPAGVTNETILAHCDWLCSVTLNAPCPNLVSEIRRQWNELADRDPARYHRLPVPPRANLDALPLNSFPESFRQDLEAYLLGRQFVDPSSTIAHRPARPLTIKGDRFVLIRAASIIARQYGAHRVTALADLVRPDWVRMVLLHLRARAGGRWERQAQRMIYVLIVMARRHVRAEETTMQELRKMQRTISTCLAEERRARHGMSIRSAERMAGLEDERILERLFALPQQKFEAALAMAEKRRVYAAQLHERALALDLLLHHPLQPRSLLGIRIDTQLRRNEHGRIIELCIPASEAVTRQEIRVVIPPDLAARIDRHLRHYRPHLRGAEGPLLFPGMDGGIRTGLDRAVAKMVSDALGIRFNLQLIRHLAARMLLDADPQNNVVVQRLLGHVSLTSTEHQYGAFRQRLAVTRWQEIVGTAHEHR
jgi:integrase